MKKIWLVFSIVTLVGAVSLQSASANRGWNSRNYGDCPQQGRYVNQVTDEQREKLNSFREDNAELRKAMISKRAEFKALMLGTNPDPGRAGRLSGELFDLQEQLQAKAKESGIAVPLSRGGMGVMRIGQRECFGPKV